MTAARTHKAMRAELEAIDSALLRPLNPTSPAARLDGVVLLYVGGRPNQVAHMRAVVKQSGATFLHHDGVPWNNNNAEHAIKRFAKYRRDAGGRFTERTLREYLVLASVFETCEFNNVNVLKFLLAKETTLEGLLKMAGRRAQTSREVSLDNNSKQNYTALGSSET